MKNYRLPVLAGTAALAAGILSGCGSPAATFEGMEVKDLDKTIESIDAMWAQNRTEGAKSNVDEESRCYAQVTELAMSNKAICGPIHYLGKDEQSWESVELSFFPSGEKEVTASVDASFSTAERAENTTLFRPDGKDLPEDLIVPEPDTKAAAPEQAIWDTAVAGSGEAMDVFVPGGSLYLSDWKISERVGTADNRVKAGEGRMFASVAMTHSSEDMVPVDLAFASDGKSYPLGKVKDGTVSMSLPGDAKDAVLEITAEGNTQTVSLASGEITSTASAYYDGLDLRSGDTQPIDQAKENGQEQKVSFRSNSNLTFRDAHEKKQGWAPEGKAWLIVDTNWQTSLTYIGEILPEAYDHTTTVTSATVEGLSGEKYTAEAVRIDNAKGPGSYHNGDVSRVVFEVPAGIGDFKVTLNVNASGPLEHKGASSNGVPPSASIDDTISYEVVFPRS